MIANPAGRLTERRLAEGCLTERRLAEGCLTERRLAEGCLAEGRLTESTCTVEITLYALKGQKLLAQGIALGNYERKPVAL